MESAEANKTFGQLVRYFRRQCVDPMRGGLVTQDRLGELIGAQIGDAGYTGAAISEWERDKSKIHADDRLVLISLLAVLVQCGGLRDRQQAEHLLEAGNYRSLTGQELATIFGDRVSPEGESFDSQPAVRHRASPTPPVRPKEQQLLLEKVRAFWVAGVLEKSRGNLPLFQVQYESCNDKVGHPWGDQLGRALLPFAAPTGLPTIAEVFDATDGALLILGAAGAGKSTKLITLAKALLERCRKDPQQPIPVILDLGNWSHVAPSIAQWVVEELTAKYQIPRRYGYEWVAANELLLLLDGLDRVPLQSRRVCMEAIDQFRETHGLTRLAVCCRSQAYEDAGRRLRLNGAIMLQPLDEAQIDMYLSESGLRTEALEHQLSQSADVRELASNPLMLKLLITAFGGKEPSGGGNKHPVSAPSVPSAEQLFDAYLVHAFAHHVEHKQYGEAQTTSGLSWLAARMNEHNQSIFLIELLQPSWLPGRRWRQLYMLLAGIISGLAGGVIMWLLWRLMRYTLPQLPAPTSAALSELTGSPVGATEPLTITLGNMALGVLMAFTLYMLFERRRDLKDGTVDVQHLRRVQTLLVGAQSGVITLLFVQWFSQPLLAVAWAVAEGFMYGAAARYTFGWSYRAEVRTVEALSWSWRSATMGAMLGLVLAIIAEVIESLLYGYNGAERTVATLLVAGFVLGGVRGRTALAKTRPNQGVWLSLRNSVVAAGLVALAMVSIAWILRDPTYAWQIGLLSAVIAIAIMGGSVFIKHFMLRAMLRYKGLVPWRYARYLEHCARLVLLRRVGNGYLFMHSLLQDYLAEKVSPSGNS